MLRNYRSQAGAQPANESPPQDTSFDTTAPMLSASSSNNHSLFSFGRSNGLTTSGARTAAFDAHQHGDGDHFDLDLGGDDDDDEDGIGDNTANFDFLPSVSFDDLQSSLESASTEFKLAQFPSPTGQGSILATHDSMAVDSRPPSKAALTTEATESASLTETMPASFSSSGTASSTARHAAAPRSTTASTTSGTTALRDAKSSSVLRRPSVNTRKGTNTASSASVSSTVTDAPTAGLSVSSRQRRQSHYPPVSSSNIAKPPRKSVGPGTFDPQYADATRSSSRRRPSLASNSDRPTPTSARSSVDGGSRLGDTAARSSNGTRAAKARSFQPPASRASISGTGTDQGKAARPAAQRASKVITHSSSYGNVNLAASTSSNKGPGGGISTSMGKRMSMVPALHTPHATGLGARTVSPTDARRMKRMSIMPNANSAGSDSGNKGTHSTSLGGLRVTTNGDAASATAVALPLPSDVRSSSRSPSMLPRKTSTPSSSRTTPDPKRKSYSSGFSVGSSTSYNTVRSSTGSIQPRLPQSATLPNIGAMGSRLPAPKVLALQTSTASMDDDEDVPPVPAIPKAYESPKDPPPDLTLFERRKSNLAFDASSNRSSSTASLSGGGQTPSVREAQPKGHRKQRVRAIQDSQTTNGVVTPTAITKKSNLQPIRLPPINLMPLSTPTTAKIAALQAHSAANASPDRDMSPLSSRISAKTPTTPMTASKGSFFSRHRNEDRADLQATVRSNSSVHRHADDTNSSDVFAEQSVFGKKVAARKSPIPPFPSSPVLKGHAKDPSDFQPPKTPVENANCGDGGFVSSLSAPPPIPPSTSSTALRKPSGPRAPAPTPSRAFAPLENTSTIITMGETSRIASDATEPSSSFAVLAPKSPPPLASPDEPPTPSSIGSSLRRKLSMSWKRNNKSSLGGSIDKMLDLESIDAKPHGQEHHLFDHHRQASSHDKHDGMPPPPPRIPKSATFSQLPSAKANSTPKSAVDSKVTETYLEARRRKSSASSLNAIMNSDKTQDRGLQKDVSAIPAVTDVNTNGTHSLNLQTHNTSVMTKILKSKASSASMRRQTDPWTVNLDGDDMLAEEEMRKLGSRRKETELSARTLDALRKRATPKERVSSQEATRIAMLNLYERGEIVDFNDIYFCGTQNAAKVAGNLSSDSPNFGYDDERGDYAIVPGDHLAYRYEIIDLLGKGSFGQVVRCIDHKSGALVAVKIIRNKKRFHQQALVEVNILQKLRDWDPKNKHSMVNFTHSFYFRGHLCISTELLDMNLYEFIKANSFRGFSLKLIRRFTKQMLSSLNLLKQHKVIHCDLKPENVLLRHPMHTEIKVIDFGSSCFENEKVYTYIQSRFYRSPEVILGMTYGMPIDMWSLGCILAELYTGGPIFPGENEQEQLACIMEVFGPPEKHLIEKSTRKKLFFDSMGKPRLTVSSKGRRRRPSSKTLQQAIKCDDEAFLDFLARCLRWDPDRRLKPDEAIRHEFITGHKSVLAPRSTHHSARDGSPVRRHHTISLSGANGPRPLPEPPNGPSSGNSKLGTAPNLRPSATARESLGGYRSTAMASTAASSRRASAVVAGSAGVTSSSGGHAKRASAGLGSGIGNSNLGGSNATSNLPRAAGRTASGGLGNGGVRQIPDLAAAGAAVAMTRRAA